MVWQADHVMHSAAPCNFRRPVAAAVVHHEVLELIDADDPSWQRRDRRRQSLRLIEARNLDDEFHRMDGDSACQFSTWLEHTNDNVPAADRSQKYLLRRALVPDRSNQIWRPV